MSASPILPANTKNMTSAARAAWLLTAPIVVTSCSAHDEGRPDRHAQQGSAAAPSPAVYRDTQWVNQAPLIETYSKAFGGHIVSLTTLAGDTAVKYAPYYFQHEYLDINKDGNLDIRMHVFSNTPNQCENYFYDSKTRTYHQISSSDLDIKKLPGTSLYYSNNRLGCASKNWASTLSKIEDWQEVQIGYIEINSCGTETEGITIYKIKDGKQQLVSTLKIQELSRSKGVLHFFDNYWKRHYKQFE
ncbi:hypothetical protein LJ737_17515 [Hymenobacter sp. 15J16-1T3B]|uniref:hypothetical protein n=1 Tax=Hymenobacter sp. 15J16-1T3B TaxID=2886941 RepID=UPI001D11865A|nr:hypothetical protein [Hymenobacter sp. 15J16-1T3B]MCC3159046.1 hypothetical protein [Hymenobacter sp. 15J16-1T3B]